ncbi:MAG: hypothetical protein QXO46_08280 [Nitrososphaerota archaeon]
MPEEVKLPDVVPSPPPDVTPEYKPIVGYISWGNDLRRYREQLIDAMTALLYVPIVGWMLYGIMYILLFTVYELIVLLADVIDGLWNSIADIINYLYIWWINFKKAVEERYQGNWWKAIVELTIRVILLMALDYALNIPAVKQLWDVFVATIQRINQWLIHLRDTITNTFSTVSQWISNQFKNLDPLIRYIFRDEIKFWSTQINSLLSGLEARLINMIQRVDTALTARFEALIKTVNDLRKEWEDLKKEMERRVAGAIIATLARSIVIYGEKEPWIEEKDNYRTDDITFRYSMPGQVESTYKHTITYRDVYFSPQIMIRTLINDLFDDNSERGKRFNSMLKTADEGFDELFSSKDTWIPISSVMIEFKKELNEANDRIKELEKEGSK